MKKKLLLTAVFFLAIIANAQEEKRIKVLAPTNTRQIRKC